MKKLCSDPDIGVCENLRRLLESRGISCEVKAEGEPVLGGQDSPLARPMPELWLADDTRFEEAMAIIHGEQTEEPEDDSDAPDAG